MIRQDLQQLGTFQQPFKEGALATILQLSPLWVIQSAYDKTAVTAQETYILMYFLT